MQYRDKITQFITQKGPTLPVHIAKVVGKDIILAGAMLSEMASKGILRISYLKIGGSPLYYMPSQGDRLQEFTGGLGEKENQVLGLLKSEKVLRDKELQPVERVILSSLKDFAVPIVVKTEAVEEKFWKWYLHSDEEAKEHIIGILEPKTEPEEKEEPQEPEKKAEPKAKEPKVEEKKVESKAKKKEKEEQKTISGEKAKVKKKKAAPKIQAAVSDEGIGKKLLTFFQEASIRVVSNMSTPGAKKRELIVECETPLGLVRAFCYAINKKRVGEADLNAAVVGATKNNLPLFFVMDGTLSKTVQERLRKDYPGVIIKEL